MPRNIYVVTSSLLPSVCTVTSDLESALRLARVFGRKVYQYTLDNSVKIQITQNQTERK